MSSRRYVIVGEGAAGTTASTQLRSLDPQAEIVVVSEEVSRPYYRAALTNYLLGELTAEQLWAAPEDHHSTHGIRRLVDQAVELDIGNRELKVAGGEALSYDALIIASGSRARPAPFDGAHLQGVLTLRDMDDAERSQALAHSERVSQAMVVGGGPLALEWAHALHHAGVEVTILLRQRHFLPGALDPVASDLLAARLASSGLHVRVGEEIEEVLGDAEGNVIGVRTKRSEEPLPCQMVAVGIGVQARSEFLRSSNVLLSSRGAVQVDNRMQTNIERVYAAGDVAEFEGKTLGLWAPAQEQAQIAAYNAARAAGALGKVAEPKTYAPGNHYMATRLYDLDFASVGDVEGTKVDQTLVDFPRGTGEINYRKLFVGGGRLLGAVMVGNVSQRVRQNGRLYKRLIDEEIDVSSVSERLLAPGFDLRAWLARLDEHNAPPPPIQEAPVPPLLTGLMPARSVPPVAPTQPSPKRIQRRTQAFTMPTPPTGK